MAGILMSVSIVAGVFMLLLACFTFVYILWVRSRIDFAIAHLEAAIDAVRSFPGLALAGLLLVAVQLIWVVFWALAAMGLTHFVGASGSTASGLIAFVMLISLYWGVQIFQNAMLFVTAASVGHWWYSAQPTSVVVGSLRRAFSTSFGSLALGSLIVAVIRALETTARGIENRARERGSGFLVLLACCLRCMLSTLGSKW